MKSRFSRHRSIAILLVFPLALAANSASAEMLSFTFTEQDHIDPAEIPDLPTLGGTMQFDGLDQTNGSNQWTVTMTNTSPTTNNSAPAITQFGFSTDPTLTSLTGVIWTLTADYWNGAAFENIVIGSSTAGSVDSRFSGGEWEASQSGPGNLVFDFGALSGGGNQVDGGVYNKNDADVLDALSGGTNVFGGAPQAFSPTFQLDITFPTNQLYKLVVVDNDSSPYLRFQNVDGDVGSAKLVDPSPDPDPTPAVVPEPSSLALLGIGAVGMAFYGWRVKRKKRRAA